jgi:endonuclease-3
VGRVVVKSPRTSKADWRSPTPARVRAISARLREIYGVPLMAPHGDPLAELVLTVLSQSTNDRNRDVAFLRLRPRLGSWEAVRQAPLDVVEEAIRPGGISKVKSVRIKAILEAIAAGAAEPPAVGPDDRLSARLDDRLSARLDDRLPARLDDRLPARPQDPTDRLSLAWLADVPLEQARDYLTSLPGVGRKTAACVLLFSFGLHDVPVDTHVSRVGMRLELLRPGAGFEELHDQMLAITAPGKELELHVNLLRHGRRTCHARSPACERCALARMCPSRGLGIAPR